MSNLYLKLSTALRALADRAEAAFVAAEVKALTELRAGLDAANRVVTSLEAKIDAKEKALEAYLPAGTKSGINDAGE